MGKWQTEYDREWRRYTTDVLRSDFGRDYHRYEVTVSDIYTLRDQLRSMGSSFDPFDVVGPSLSKGTQANTPVVARPRRSSVRFQTHTTPSNDTRRRFTTSMALKKLEESQESDADTSDADFPATQVLSYPSDHGDIDSSQQSEGSYVYMTPQPSQRRRQRSPANAVSSAERQPKRSSTTSTRASTSFPTFMPHELNGSKDQTRMDESASLTLKKRMQSVSPITRIRFSVGSVLNESTDSTGDDEADADDSSVLFAVGAQKTVESATTPQRETTPGKTKTPEEKVVDLDVSMQSMNLEDEDEGDADGDVAMDADDGITAALDFDNASDDEDDEVVPATYCDDMDFEELRPRSSPAKRWQWTESTTEAEPEQEPPQAQQRTTAEEEEDVEVIEINDDFGQDYEPPVNDDDDHAGDSQSQEVIVIDGDSEHSVSVDTMLQKRLRTAGLMMSDDEDAARKKGLRDPFESSTSTANKGSPTASSSSASSPKATVKTKTTRKAPASTKSTRKRKVYYRTKLPLPVEAVSTHAEGRRRERRWKQLKKKLTTATIPECRVELAPYQREAVDWMLQREELSPTPVMRSEVEANSSRDQREGDYDRLTAKLRGGILADEMGLGKTVCCLAMICESLKKVREELSSDDASDSAPRLKPPTLIITPLSILGQWEKEIRDKTNLSVLSYQGAARRQIQSIMDFMGVDIVLSTYDTLRLKEVKVAKGKPRKNSQDNDGGGEEDDDDEDTEDMVKIFDDMNDSRQWRTAVRRLSLSKKSTPASKLHQMTWYRVILDESHLITNPACARASAALILKSKRRWCVTGTPIQNSGKDLTSLMTFLGVQTQSLSTDVDLQEVLKRVMLRRLKSTVDSESNEPIVALPEKQEHVVQLEFESDLENAYYTLLHRSTKKRVIQYLRRQGRGSGQFMHVFELLLRLRQCCDSTSLITDDPKRELQDGNGALLAEIGTLSRQDAALLERAAQMSDVPKYSTKIVALLKELRRMKRSREHGLVISQWTSYLDLIADAIQEENTRRQGGGTITFCRLDGSMTARERDEVITSFQVDKRVDVLLVSLRTGGLGLNLTTASQVFIMEPSWNPSIESQAVDRAHRVGQTKRVRVVRFLMKNTIEERVVELQKRKKSLAMTTLGDDPTPAVGPSKETALTREELRELFSQELESDNDSLDRSIWQDME